MGSVILGHVDVLWHLVGDLARLTGALWFEFVKGLPTLVLAVASIFVAFMSWRTAQRANALTSEHWEADRLRSELRARRVLAVDMRTWYTAAFIPAILGSPRGAEHFEEERRLRAQLETEGEAEGLRLLEHLDRQLEQMRLLGPVESAKELAQRTHPSRMMWWADLEPMISRWAQEPTSVLAEIEVSEREQADKARAAAYGEALRRAAERANQAQH